jgi:hypothetical protein
VQQTINGSDKPLANSAILIAHAITNPFRTAVIELPEKVSPQRQPTKKPGQEGQLRTTAPMPRAHQRSITASPTFNVTLLVVIVITLLTGVAQIALASTWLEPTAIQQSTFDAMGTAWKMGFGALVGLLSGKVSR